MEPFLREDQFERLFQAVADEPDLQRVMVDATVVRAHACAASAPVIGLVGDLIPLKGQSTFIEAAREVAAACPEARCVLVGAPRPGAESQAYAEGLWRQVQAAGLAGRVLFAGELRGLATTVVIDHGQQLVSVVAGLGRAHVAAGTWVEAERPLGDPAGDRIYVELRRAGRPIDPEPFLAND